MISALIIASLAIVTPTTNQAPAPAATTTRCTIQQVHLPAGKIGPINTIERCKKVDAVAIQDAGPATGKHSGRARN